MKKRILLVGDIMQHDAQLQSHNTIDPEYEKLAMHHDHDIVIGNLETSIISESFLKGYPQFAAPPQFLQHLSRAGFTHLTLANNHALDWGSLGLMNTIRHIDQTNMKWCGANGRSHIDIDDNIVLHSYTMKSNEDDINSMLSWLNVDALPIAQPNKVNIIYIHGGREYEKDPTYEQQVLSEKLSERGFQFIIWCHSHVVGKIETHNNKSFVVWGMGNYVSWQKNLDRQLGLLLTINIDDTLTGNIEAQQIETTKNDFGVFIHNIYPYKI